MSGHPALAAGKTAVITGAADGVGLAVSRRLAAMGMNVVMADLEGARLDQAAELTRGEAAGSIEACATDVADRDAVLRLKSHAFDKFGRVDFLMNNAGVSGGAQAHEYPERWDRVLAINLGGVINGVQAFTQAMIDQGGPAAIVNTGSKQGITMPPGDTAYNVTKAAIKALTEGLQHTLRETPGCAVTAHLLIPGFTFTGLTRARIATKPPGAWTAEQVADFMVERLGAGDFYILCPDNDTPRALDEARMAWTAGDIIENRPPLSRWHPEYKDAFAAFVENSLSRQ
jgi:NAD(P)-dependent dehydrogenase (short-subunit alcohol dehydrogenase family)